MCHLTGLRDAQIVDKIFLGVSVRMSQEEISNGIHRLSKEDPPSPVRVGIIQLAEGLIRTKMWRKGEFALFA